jgi:aspartate racemase
LKDFLSEPTRWNCIDIPLGIVGGVGPLASAEFLKTIYEFQRGKIEQQTPIVIMYSNPKVPDRSEALLTGSSHVLFEALIEAVQKLSSAGVAKIVVCCITLHYIFPDLPLEIQKIIIPLTDIILHHLQSSKKKYLMLCTTGTRNAGVFQKHRVWSCVQDQVVFPNEEDQRLIHDLIYKQIKRGYALQAWEALLVSLLRKYQVTSFIAGCTELHLLTKQFFLSPAHQKNYSCIDPLLIIARALAEGAS